MKTDDLISMLSTNVEAVERRQLTREIWTTVAVGAVVAIGVMLLGLGVRGGVSDVWSFTVLLAKFGFAIGVVLLASFYLVKLARPGGERKLSLSLLVLPFAAVMLLALISLAFAPPAHWSAMAMGDEWLECLISIPIIAVVPFAAVIWVLRRMAPTDLTRTGALAGLLAGGLSAIGYALHCTMDSLPFIALWYGGTIVLCTLVGALLGPRLLRW